MMSCCGDAAEMVSESGCQAVAYLELLNTRAHDDRVIDTDVCHTRYRLDFKVCKGRRHNEAAVLRREGSVTIRTDLQRPNW